MPNRIIREAILSSEKIALLSWAEEVFYRRLLSIVDDYGRYEANPQLLRSKCYPLHTDLTVKAKDVTSWLGACQRADLIACYEVGGKKYLQVSNFGQQQRTPSKFPPPPAVDINCQQPPANEHLGVSVSGVVSGVVGDARASAAPPPVAKKERKTGLAEDFGVSERVQAWAREKGYGQLPEHLEAFKRKATAKGYTYVDWDAAFMEAIREDWAKLRGRTRDGVAPPAEPRHHDSAEDTRRMLAEKDKGTKPPPAHIREQINAALRGKVLQ